MKKCWFYTFQHFSPFFTIYMANYPFEKYWCVQFLRGGGSEKVCFVHSFKCWQLWTTTYTEKDNFFYSIYHFPYIIEQATTIPCPPCHNDPCDVTRNNMDGCYRNKISFNETDPWWDHRPLETLVYRDSHFDNFLNSSRFLLQLVLITDNIYINVLWCLEQFYMLW